MRDDSKSTDIEYRDVVRVRSGVGMVLKVRGESSKSVEYKRKEARGSERERERERASDAVDPLDGLPHERCIRRLTGGAIKSRQQTDRQSPLPATPNTWLQYTNTGSTLTAETPILSNVYVYASTFLFRPLIHVHRSFLVSPFPSHYYPCLLPPTTGGGSTIN